MGNSENLEAAANIGAAARWPRCVVLASDAQAASAQRLQKEAIVFGRCAPPRRCTRCVGSVDGNVPSSFCRLGSAIESKKTLGARLSSRVQFVREGDPTLISETHVVWCPVFCLKYRRWYTSLFVHVRSSLNNVAPGLHKLLLRL